MKTIADGGGRIRYRTPEGDVEAGIVAEVTHNLDRLADRFRIVDTPAEAADPGAGRWIARADFFPSGPEGWPDFPGGLPRVSSAEMPRPCYGPIWNGSSRVNCAGPTLAGSRPARPLASRRDAVRDRPDPRRRRR